MEVCTLGSAGVVRAGATVRAQSTATGGGMPAQPTKAATPARPVARIDAASCCTAACRANSMGSCRQRGREGCTVVGARAGTRKGEAVDWWQAMRRAAAEDSVAQRCAVSSRCDINHKMECDTKVRMVQPQGLGTHRGEEGEQRGQENACNADGSGGGGAGEGGGEAAVGAHEGGVVVRHVTHNLRWV